MSRADVPAVAVRFPSVVGCPKEELLEVCATLALGESLLGRLGRPREARSMARAFELMEGRLAEGAPPPHRPTEAVGQT